MDNSTDNQDQKMICRRGAAGGGGKFVASPRIELGCQVPETCVLSIVLRGQSSKTTGKKFGREMTRNVTDKILLQLIRVHSCHRWQQ